METQNCKHLENRFNCINLYENKAKDEEIKMVSIFVALAYNVIQTETKSVNEMKSYAY